MCAIISVVSFGNLLNNYETHHIRGPRGLQVWGSFKTRDRITTGTPDVTTYHVVLMSRIWISGSGLEI